MVEAEEKKEEGDGESPAEQLEKPVTETKETPVKPKGTSKKKKTSKKKAGKAKSSKKPKR